MGLFAPSDTPSSTLKTLREVTRAAVHDPEFQAAMEKIKADIAYLDGPEFVKFWAEDAARLEAALRKRAQKR